MEMEAKYVLRGQDDWALLQKDERLRQKTEPGSDRIRRMLAIYYDTPRYSLRSIRAAYRVRLEGDAYVATVKCGGTVGGGMHRRLEWNAEQPDASPNPELFLQNTAGQADGMEELRPVVELLQREGVMEVCRSDFTRISRNIGWEGARFELAMDQGELAAGGRTEPLREIELELLSGDPAAFDSLLQWLKSRYPMEPEDRSKYGRCLKLLETNEK